MKVDGASGNVHVGFMWRGGTMRKPAVRNEGGPRLVLMASVAQKQQCFRLTKTARNAGQN